MLETVLRAPRADDEKSRSTEKGRDKKEEKKEENPS
jgi:hypothetical protein